MAQVESHYANEVHQLTITVSQHFWVSRDQIVKYQKKELGQNLRGVARSAKNHVLIYLLRDHFSGLYYSQATTSQELMRPATFLDKAWSLKVEGLLSGKPRQLTLPAQIEAAFPGTRDSIERLGIEVVDARAGVQAGQREIHEMEVLMGHSYGKSLQYLLNTCHAAGVHAEREPSRVGGLSKGGLWAQHLR